MFQRHDKNQRWELQAEQKGMLWRRDKSKRWVVAKMMASYGFYVYGLLICAS